MKVTQSRPNVTELLDSIGTVILVSYETPVAALLPSGRYVRTSKKYSVTTSKHINQWLGGNFADEVSPEYLNQLVGE